MTDQDIQAALERAQAEIRQAYGHGNISLTYGTEGANTIIALVTALQEARAEIERQRHQIAWLHSQQEEEP